MKNERTFHHPSKTLKTLVVENPKTDTKHDFSSLPHDILNKIGSHFSLRDVQRACLVCKSWRNGLWPLWEQKTFLQVRRGKWRWFSNYFDDFLYKKASLYMLALVVAGLVFWEIDKNNKDGDHTLPVPAEPPNMKEAVTWLYQASKSEYVRQQYQLALCLQRAIGTNQNLKEAEGLRLTGAMYLDMAERRGVKAATDVKNAMLLTLPPSSRESVRILARSWHPTRPSRWQLRPGLF